MVIASKVWSRPRVRTLVLWALVGLWVFACARLLARQAAQPNPAVLVFCGLLVIAPLIVLNIKKLPSYLLAGYAALVPVNDLLVTTSGATVGKLLAIVAGGSLVIAMLATRRIVPPSKSLFVLAAFIAYVGATVFWAIDQSKAQSFYVIYLSYIVLFIAIALYPATKSEMRVVLGGAVAGALILAVYGIYLYQTGQQVFDSRLYIGAQQNISIDPNEFAASMLAPVAVTIMLFLRSTSIASRALWLAVTVVILGGFLVSGSRGGTVALAAMLLFMFVRSPYKGQLTAIILSVMVGAIASPIGQRLSRADVATGDGRFDIWKVGIASLREYWWHGAGVGNYDEAFAKYFLSTPHIPLPWDRVAHSVFIQSAVEYGIVGFVLVMAVWYLMFRELAGEHEDPLENDLAIALRAGVLGLFVAGFSLDLMMYKYTWLALSLVALMRSSLLAGRAPPAPPAER